MSDTSLAETRIQVTTEYFRKIDSGHAEILDLMTDNVEIYFPKFGVGYGKAEFMEVVKGLMGCLQSIKHDIDRFRFHVTRDHVIVEGFEEGVMADGTAWPVEGHSEGRFANVFEFEGDRIKRVFIYVDPDFASADKDRFRWGDRVRVTKA